MEIVAPLLPASLLGTRTPPRRFALLGWILLPILAYFLSHAAFVRPAQRQLAHAQQMLLAAEREELSAEVELESVQRRRQRLWREVRSLSETAERMRRAERTAELQLEALKNNRRPDYILPGGSRPRTNYNSGD